MSLAPYMSCHNLCLRFGTQPLFENLSFSIHPGERIGIVGPNGAGKSTLFRILTGVQQADTGTVSIRNGIRTAVVTQSFLFSVDKTVEQILQDALPDEYNLELQLKKIESELELHTALAAKNECIMQDNAWSNKFTELNDKLSQLTGVQSENIISSALRLGKLLHLKDRAFGQLSGGQQKCLQILAALLKNPHLILLDEPTNHLDVQTVDWLEEFLLEVVEQGAGLFGMKGKNEGTEPVAFVLISHDRALLDTLVHKIIEIEGGAHKVYEGNYESYSQQKIENELVDQKTRAKMSNLMRRELEWLRTGAKARTTKQKSRIDRALALDKDLQGKKQKANAVKNIQADFVAKIVDTKRDSEDNFVPVVRNIGEQELVNLKQVCLLHPDHKKQSEYVFFNLDLIIKPKMRIALLGPNGCGKSTLMNLIAFNAKPKSGEVVYHELVKISYFDQKRNHLNFDESVKSTLAPEGDYVYFSGKYIHIMSYLDRFLFDKYDATRLVKNLSGGEQARLLLAKLMLEQGNLLILDEPTNDLDISTLLVLERNLNDFQGGVLFTSHDRYFVQRVATGMLTYLGQKNVGSEIYGEWMMLPDLDQALEQMESYEEKNQIQKYSTLSKSSSIEKNSDEKETVKKKKMTFREQKELKEIEEKIQLLENKIQALTSDLETAYAESKDYLYTSKLSEELKVSENNLSRLYEDWERFL